jgi:Na+-transporting NADH:ubiquinone oxidoreductase subunit F
MSRDYSLLGPRAALAVQRGLAEVDWYLSPVPRETMQQLMVRRDGPALRDCLLWVGLLGFTGWLGWYWWGSLWAILPFAAYGVLYATVSDSRWHESSHGTPFRTDWCNFVLYEIASFMVQRESIPWRWSHNRHHSDTMVVGRDPEIQAPRPTKIVDILGKFIAWKAQQRYYRRLVIHAFGRMDAEERAYVPESEFPKIFLRARICLGIYLLTIIAAWFSGSILPCMYIGLPTLYGTWLMPFFTLTQHAGLREDVLDHRLNSRTVTLNPILRWLYWNMNFHIEHHMYPMVPYHALPQLHAVLKDDLPPATPGLLAAFREIIPALWRQRREPGWAIARTLPPPRAQSLTHSHGATTVDSEGWIDVGDSYCLGAEQVRRIDLGRQTYALYRTKTGAIYATDGICTHGNRHLGDGLIVEEHIECPKHNGRFHLTDGAPSRPPACRALRTYPIEESKGRIRFHPGRPRGMGQRQAKTIHLRVVTNRNLTPRINEVAMEPCGNDVAFTPGDYLQIVIPSYGQISYANISIASQFESTWTDIRHLTARHEETGRLNNYSIASTPADGRLLRFTIRLALPPAGTSLPPGVGSSWMFHLRPGDQVEALGPFGDFHIQPTLREMVYIGGGAGMAPIRAHLGALLSGAIPTERRISFWYGARKSQDLLYHEEFLNLAKQLNNFRYEAALSDVSQDDRWCGERGFIHEVVHRRYLASHPNPTAIEYYLCGPPPMVEACLTMLRAVGVDERMIFRDAF